MSPAVALKNLKKRVLVLDDDSEMGELCRDFLESLNYEVRVFESPADAITALNRENFDVALSDFNTPEMNGLSFMGEVHRRNPNLPVILMSASDGHYSIFERANKGTFDFLTKPFNLGRLKSAVEKAAAIDHNKRTI